MDCKIQNICVNPLERCLDSKCKSLFAVGCCTKYWTHCWILDAVVVDAVVVLDVVLNARRSTGCWTHC